ncbi:Pentatricopeptide repeat-containing protein [Apostasia shenzhenica]|uniref:Pentatricopeptide repeat-containing protein n=1 Tax=Apostasia shenzhenica TaxID=1088818 RepID=A0A2I0B7L5_9ASPA|nr:Pentatricopeptide repeat-containing protein [Apostasia shenzhenica]
MLLRDGLAPNEVTFGALVDGLVKLGRTVDARRIFDLMRERGFRANEFVYSALIAGSFQSNDPEAAFILWETMIRDGVKPNEIVYKALVDGLCRLGRMAEAEDVLLKMTAEACTPNVRTHCALMWGHFLAGSSQRALATWTNMARREPNESEELFSSLLNRVNSLVSTIIFIHNWKSFRSE